MVEIACTFPFRNEKDEGFVEIFHKLAVTKESFGRLEPLDHPLCPNNV